MAFCLVALGGAIGGAFAPRKHPDTLCCNVRFLESSNADTLSLELTPVIIVHPAKLDIVDVFIIQRYLL